MASKLNPTTTETLSRNGSLPKGWRMVRFDELAHMVNERVDPSATDAEIYVGLEHLDPDSLKLRRWGTPSDVIGDKLQFRKGDIIFGRRRAYQRKLAVAEFDGICSAHAMVVRSNTNTVDPDFLPFLMQSDLFMQRAIDISVGSLSPTINWTTLRIQEFPLPPKDEQRRIAETLRAADEVAQAHLQILTATNDLACSLRSLLGVKESLQIDLRRIDDFVPPAGWKKVTGKQLVCAPITRGYTPTGAINTESANIPFIKVYNLSFDGSLDFSKDPTFIEASAHEGELLRSQTIPGDVLINLTGPPMGKVSLVPETYPSWNINQAIARYRISDRLIRDYFLIYLQSHWAQNWFEKRAKKTSGQKNITLQLAQDLPIPIPPREEMSRFVETYQAVNSSREFARQHSNACSSLKAALLNGYFA